MSVAEVERLTRQSQFVFRGTIEKLEASTFPELHGHEPTAIVKVAEVLHAPSTLDDFTGREVTVLLNEPERVEPGQEAVFFATSWLYGESIAVVDVGRVSGAGVDTARKAVPEVIRRMDEERLQDRLARASLVIVGKVRETRPHKSEKRQPITEHAPDWWEAFVVPRSVEKGRAAEGQEVPVLFPASTDEMWIDSPKFEAGQSGIWILQRNQKERGWPAMRETGLTALDPLDFQPQSQLERVRELLGRQR